MELKGIVHDLEHGIKLKELGVKQDSCFYYTHIGDSSKLWIKNKQGKNLCVIDYCGKESIIRLSAFTSAELLELLPKFIIVENTYCYLFMNTHNGFHVEYKCNLFFEDKKPSNALAEMLIYVIKNKLIEWNRYEEM